MTVIEPTRAIVEENEIYNGKIIPTEQASIDRPVRLQSGAIVEGSVYGETISIDDATVEGSLMASGAIELDGGEVDGEVGTPGKITGSGCTVYGTMIGTRIRLTNAVVYGNLVASEAILEDSLVIGIVSTDEKLDLQESLCYTFKTSGRTTINESSIVLPQARVEGEIAFETPLAVTGLGKLDVVNGGIPTLDESDLVEVNGMRHVSLAPRILNLEKVTDRLEQLESQVTEVVTATSREDTPSEDELLEVLGVTLDNA